MDTLNLVGSRAPGFRLRDLNGVEHSQDSARGSVLVLIFWSSECPHVRRLDEALAPSPTHATPRVAVWRIASNANEAPQALRRAAEAARVSPVLLDLDGQVADAYQAQVTPHVFVLDREGVVRYSGAPDNVTFRQRTPTRSYLQDAVAAVLQGGIPEPAETPAFGCALTRPFSAG
jgi:peroxiredoxin